MTALVVTAADGALEAGSSDLQNEICFLKKNDHYSSEKYESCACKISQMSKFYCLQYSVRFFMFICNVWAKVKGMWVNPQKVTCLLQFIAYPIASLNFGCEAANTMGFKQDTVLAIMEGS